MIGIHMAIALPLTVVEIIAPTTPVETIQLHGVPEQKASACLPRHILRNPACGFRQYVQWLGPTALGSVEKP